MSQSSQSASKSAKDKGLRKPPSRPQLMGPPTRPKPPVPAPAPTPAKAVIPPEPEIPAEPQPLGPIPVPSERMQYRAIGLLKGKYVASEEQFNRGDIALADGTLIDAVLLGRVTSLIKKHVDLETEHLWVVYPRTLYKEENEPALHMQIVGVWEPETLSSKKDSAKKDSAKEDGAKEDDADKDGDDDTQPQILSSAEAEERHNDSFSIRGEVAKYDEDKGEIVINIVQKSKSETAKPKRPFKLLVSGKLTGRTTGYFWDLDVKREGGQLVLVAAKSIAVVPPKKKSKEERKRSDRRRPAAAKPRTTPVPKPKPKPKDAAEKAAEKAPTSDAIDESKSEVTKPEVTKPESAKASNTKSDETEPVSAPSEAPVAEKDVAKESVTEADAETTEDVPAAE
ncbi:MAG: hypothetical protein AAGC93_15855 [Cyanobacteria bacterium P01_F01_bin.53]